MGVPACVLILLKVLEKKIELPENFGFSL